MLLTGLVEISNEKVGKKEVKAKRIPLLERATSSIFLSIAKCSLGF